MILGLADIRRKGNGSKKVHRGYMFIYSGGTAAKNGVGFLLHPDLAECILEINNISDRIVTLKIKIEEQIETFIQIYAPCNDSYTEDEKDEFFDELSEEITKVDDSSILYVMGDFNGRVGINRKDYEQFLGPHAVEHERNGNGQRILELCSQHQLFITNTFYEHRDSQKYTWYKWNDNTIKSQIDYILTRTKGRYTILDSKVIPNGLCDTDHKIVILTTRRATFRKMRNKASRNDNLIKIANLKQEGVQEQLQQKVEIEFKLLPPDVGYIEDEWVLYKTALLDAAEELCGKQKGGKRSPKNKRSPWWCDEVKEAVKLKKAAYKSWIKSKNEQDYVKYRLQRRECNRIVKKAKQDSWERFGQSLAENERTASRKFYKLVRSIRKKDENYNPTEIINDKNGKPLTDPSEAIERWKEYFEELLNPPGNLLEKTLQTAVTSELEPKVLIEEVEKVVKQSPNYKAPGADRLPAEIIKAAGDCSIRWLHRIFNAAWKQQIVPLDWQTATVIPLWKNKGSKRECNQYRGISLLSHAGKMFAKIIESRLRPVIELQLSEEQMGFRKNRSCTDAIFTLKQLIETHIEYNKELYIAFIDQEKAFDRVDRNLLWQIMAQYGVSEHLISLCKSLYSNCRTTVKTSYGTSNPFEVTTGVRQGCVLSPLLFIIYIDSISRNAKPTEENKIKELLFADDQALIADTKRKLQLHLESLNQECKQSNMRINTEKTEVMAIGRRRKNINITIENTIIRQAKEFKYLGTTFTEDGKIDEEINIRCSKANQVLGQLAPLLQNKAIPMSTKRHLIQSIFIPILCYQCQTWSLTTTHQRKLVSTEMRCLRKAAGVTRRDKLRNEIIRERVGTEAVLSYIQRQQIRWFAHLERMPYNSIPFKAYTKRGEGHRARGRPRRRWEDNIKETLQQQRLSISEAARRARTRTLHLPRHPER